MKKIVSFLILLTLLMGSSPGISHAGSGGGGCRSFSGAGMVVTHR